MNPMTKADRGAGLADRRRAGPPLKRVDLVREVVERIRGQILAGAYQGDGLLPPEARLGEENLRDQ